MEEEIYRIGFLSQALSECKSYLSDIEKMLIHNERAFLMSVGSGAEKDFYKIPESLEIKINNLLKYQSK